MKYITLLLSTLGLMNLIGQDLSLGLVPDDFSPHPMQELEKPGYLETVMDPSFGTTIRRISDAVEGEAIRTMYSTVQAWNADESRMILYKAFEARHLLLDGVSYAYLRDLDINPSDLEEVFWHFEDPELLYYMDRNSGALIEYNIESDSKNEIADLRGLTGCADNTKSGNDVQMMSWDSDVFTFRCGSTSTWSYSISTETLKEIAVAELGSVAANVFPSGQRYLHSKEVYNVDGELTLTLDVASGSEHSCLGRDAAGNDTYFAIAFAESPDGGCLGEVIAYDPASGACRTIVGTDLGYSYPQSGTHISALAHKNTEGGWLTASMVGYDQDGMGLLDQELLIAQVRNGQSTVYRIAHHRSDEDQFDYWGEPHPVISPSGTRVLFNSDWSGAADGFAVDAYVVELPVYQETLDVDDNFAAAMQVYPNPAGDEIYLGGFTGQYDYEIHDVDGLLHLSGRDRTASAVDVSRLSSGVYYLAVTEESGVVLYRRMVKL